jgi:hypothetical protein
MAYPKGQSNPRAGRPSDADIQARREAFRKCVPTKRLVEIIKAQVEKAAAGELDAAKFICDGLFGPDRQTVACEFSKYSDADLIATAAKLFGGVGSAQSDPAAGSDDLPSDGGPVV